MAPRAEEVGPTESFDLVLDGHLVRVRRALVARYGLEIGSEAAAEVSVWAWSNRARLADADNPSGLLFRVGQSSARPHHRWVNRRADVELVPDDVVESHRPELVDLFRALPQLREPERVAVVLVHAHGERYEDVAHLLGVSVAAVTNHVHRGLTKLRMLMGEQP